MPLLDLDLLRSHPKIFVGYSDTTVLSVAIWCATGLVTFYGPALLTDFAEHPALFDYTRDGFLRVLCEAGPSGPLGPASGWTDELLDWGAKRDLERPRRCVSTPGWTWLKRGAGEGVLLGGCLESLQHLRGTRFWPDWSGAILFFETSNQKPDAVDGMLMDYQNMGVLDRLRGMLVGRPWGYTQAERRELLEVLLDRSARFDFPIVADMDFGHTAPQLTLPLGCLARIDAGRQRFELLEAAVS